MTDNLTASVADDPARRTAGWARWAVLGGVVAGSAVTLLVVRRQVYELVVRAKPYATRAATVSAPVLIVNRWSGDGKADTYDLCGHANRIGVRTVMLEKGDDLVRLAHDAVDSGADAVGMAGGDGSLGLVAGVAVERELPFFCIPVGTRNHFALDLGLNRDDPVAALGAVGDGEQILVDYGTANGRPFLNNVSFGVYAQAVHEPGYRADKTATLADKVARATVDAGSQARLRYSTPDGTQHERAPLLLVANNPYHFSGYPDFGRRLRLDSGMLGIAALTDLTDDTTLDVALEDLAGLHEWTTASYRVESDEPIEAGLDGEAVTFRSPLTLQLHRRALGVLVPAGTRPGLSPRHRLVAAHLADLAETAGIGEA